MYVSLSTLNWKALLESCQAVFIFGFKRSTVQTRAFYSTKLDLQTFSFDHVCSCPRHWPQSPTMQLAPGHFLASSWQQLNCLTLDQQYVICSENISQKGLYMVRFQPNGLLLSNGITFCPGLLLSFLCIHDRQEDPASCALISYLMCLFVRLFVCLFVWMIFPFRERSKFPQGDINTKLATAYLSHTTDSALLMADRVSLRRIRKTIHFWGI